MRFLLVLAKKLKSTILQELNTHYSVLSIDNKHLNKTIHQIGTAEVIVCNLNLGLFHNTQQNTLLKWLNEQDISGFKVVYCYSKTKYQKVFTKANLYLKECPLVVGRTLAATINLTERMADGSQSLSISAADMKAINSSIVEIDTDIETDRLIAVLQEFKQLKLDYSELQEHYNELKQASQPVRVMPPKPEVKVKPIKRLVHVQGGIECYEGDRLVSTLRYNNVRQQRGCRKDAMVWMRQA